MPKKIIKNIPQKSLISVGRRKRSSATATLSAGTGKIIVNGLALDKYFYGVRLQTFLTEPLTLTKTNEKFDIVLRVAGGGKYGQIDACRMAIGRVLTKSDSDFKSILRQNGILTRDSRKRERRKVGTGGKARRQKQSPKR